MPAINFKIKYRNPILDGIKTHTIRKNPRRNSLRAKPGQTAYLYNGMRTKHCSKIGEATILAEIPLIITKEHLMIGFWRINGNSRIQRQMMNLFAYHDGFENFSEFFEFFATNYDIPFNGRLIVWDPRDVTKTSLATLTLGYLQELFKMIETTGQGQYDGLVKKLERK